jgi:nitroreductase
MEVDPSGQIQALIRAAVLAPSSHNTQPWLFRVSASDIDLIADRTRALPVNDPRNRELSISCGCALENLRVAAAGQGLGADIQLLPDANDPDWLARVALGRGSPATSEDRALVDCIERRRTHRDRFAPQALGSETVDQLIKAAETHGTWLKPFGTGEPRSQAADLVAEGDAAQWSDRAWRHELAAWMHPQRLADGLTVPTPALTLARLLVRSLDLGRILGKRDRALAQTAPLLAVLVTTGDGPRDWLGAGQALQRILLAACRLGLQASYLNQPVQVPTLRSRLQRLIGGGHPQVLLRLGYPAQAIPATPRRPIADVVRGPFP